MSRLYPIELCKYTLRKAMCDDGNYVAFHTAQELINVTEYSKEDQVDLNLTKLLMEEKQNGRTKHRNN